MPATPHSGNDNKSQHGPLGSFQTQPVQNFNHCNGYSPQQVPYQTIDHQYVQQYYQHMQQQQQQQQYQQQQYQQQQYQQQQYQQQQYQQQYSVVQQYPIVQHPTMPQQQIPDYYHYQLPQTAATHHQPSVSPTNALARPSFVPPPEASDHSTFEQPHYQYGQQPRYSYPVVSARPHSELNRAQSLPVLLKSNKVCDVCQKIFNRPSGLRTHMHTHTGQKPYLCTWNGCSKKFSVRSNMIRHMKIHQRNET